MNSIKKISLLILILFYFSAGLYHFIKPEMYYPLIPDYLPFPKLINYLSGSLELLFSIGVIIPKTRKISLSLIILMLVAFIPSHIYFIQIGSCAQKSLCVPEWISWGRLIIIHPLLILWAWFHKN